MVANDFEGFTSIEDNALSARQLTSVELPNTITSIGTTAFEGNQLTLLNIPNSVISIGDGAFANNPWTSSSSITLPREFDNPTERERIGLPFEINLELSPKTNTGEIEESEIAHLSEVDQTITDNSLALIKKLFDIQNATDQNLIDGLKIKISSGDNKIVTLTTNEGFKINETLTLIESIAFALNPIEPPITGDILTKEIADGFFANAGKWNGKKKLVASDFEGFSSIGDYALSDRNLTSIELPNEIISIGDYSFFRNVIINFTFGQKIERIGAYAFDHNELQGIVLPNTLTTMGEGAFINQFSGLFSVTIPGSLREVPKLAFANTGLSKLIINNGVTSIGMTSFQGHALTELTIPNSVTKIGDDAFESCNHVISKITLPAQFDNPTERARIGLSSKTLAFPLLVNSTLIRKLK